MLRFASFLPCAVGVLTVSSGCCGPSAECEIAAIAPEIQQIEARYALGSRTRIRVRGRAPWTIQSSDPSIVRIEAIEREDDDDNGHVMLRFVGVGRAALRVENDLASVERMIEVLAHDRFVALLGERTGVALGPIDDEVILAGRQDLVLIYLDAQGRALYGSGLARLTLPPSIHQCEQSVGAVERHGIWVAEPGPHAVAIRVGDQRALLRFEAVLPSDIIDIEVLAPDEEALQPETWTQVDVLGVTRDSARVRGMHPRFQVGNDSYLGYFAYRYDPSAPLQALWVEALGWRRALTFRGLTRQE
jgi:hypothetical protein